MSKICKNERQPREGLKQTKNKLRTFFWQKANSNTSFIVHSKRRAKRNTILNSFGYSKNLRISFHFKIRRVNRPSASCGKRHHYKRTHRFVLHVLLLICHFKLKPQMVDGNPMTSRKVLHRSCKNSKTVLFIWTFFLARAKKGSLSPSYRISKKNHSIPVTTSWINEEYFNSADLFCKATFSLLRYIFKRATHLPVKKDWVK